MGDPNAKKAVDIQSSQMVKGGEVNLMGIDPGLHKAFVGVGWDAPEQNEGFPVDIDVSAFLLKGEGRVRRDTDFIFYNNLESENGSVKHTGDNTTGAGDGDDEVIELKLEEIPFDVDKVVFTVTIHNAEERHQTFGIVKSAFIRIVNLETKIELAKFDLSEDASSDNSIIFGELARDGMGWKFRAIGTSSGGGLYRLARDYGVNVSPA